MIANTPQAWSERAASATSWEAALWSEQGQRDRFGAVIKALDPRPLERLLDFGCGTGALADLLPAGVAYVGCDWSEGMIERAAADHPDRDFTTERPYDPVDLVACVGPFNLRHNWEKDLTWHQLFTLWTANHPRTLACSLYTGDDPDCLRYEIDEIGDFGRSLTKSVSVAAYRSNDALLVLRR